MNQSEDTRNLGKIRWLTYMMFMMFAMTTDAVGKIIPEVMAEFDLNMTEAGLVHYAPMAAIAIAGIGLGFLADKFGRKQTIRLGLAIFACVSFLFAIGNSFWYYLMLMVFSGLAVGIFKTAALALIGDISRSNREHTSTMNGVEAFFGVGAIIGPLIVTWLIASGVHWKWLYVIAGILCFVLIIVSATVKYPTPTQSDAHEKINVVNTIMLLKNKYAVGFSLAAFLYVATESAIYVWMPTFLLGYDGNFVWLAVNALTIFFVLRALGRFMGIWLMAHFNWAVVTFCMSGAILICFALSVFFGKNVAAVLLPLSGLFMSVMYPTINSKGISCFEANQHGSAAGIILFFTALGAVFGPLAMAIVGDMFGGNAYYGFVVATCFAFILFVGFLYNLVFSPVEKRLQAMEASVYQQR